MTENGGELVFMFRGEITEFQFYQNRKAEKLIMMPFCQEDLEMHGHNFFELAYITGGTAEHTLENEGKTISAGDYFFVDYGCLHGFQNCKNLTLINCLFLPETVDETLQGCRSFSQLLQGCLLKYYRMSLGQAKFARVFHDRDGQVGQLMQEMLLEYHKIRPISFMEWQNLRVRFTYPEKYWKLANYYYSHKKVWISEKNVEKLANLIRQKEAWRNFGQNCFRKYSFSDSIMQ